MSTTNQTFKAVFEQALLADAAYAKGLGGLGYGDFQNLTARLKESGFGISAAAYVADRFLVIRQSPEEPGFSAAALRSGRRGGRLGQPGSEVRQSSGFAGICGTVVVRRLAQPGARRDADWQTREHGDGLNWPMQPPIHRKVKVLHGPIETAGV